MIQAVLLCIIAVILCMIGATLDKMHETLKRIERQNEKTYSWPIANKR